MYSVVCVFVQVPPSITATGCMIPETETGFCELFLKT